MANPLLHRTLFLALGALSAACGDGARAPARSVTPEPSALPGSPEPAAPPVSAAPPSADPPGTASATVAPTAPLATVPVAAAGPPQTSQGSGGPAGAGPAAPGAGARADVVDLQVTGGAIEDATRVVDAMRAGFLRCYERGLSTKSDAKGEVTLTIRVGAAGQVLGVTAQRTTLVPQTVVSCITGRAGAASFAPPTGTRKKVDVAVALKIALASG